MGREIKFRAWNKSTKTMVDLQKLTPLALSETMNTQLTMKRDGGLFIPFCDELPLMQYTGLKDKNGVEIYEGDIVLAFCNINEISDPHLVAKREPEFSAYDVRYLKGGFVLANKEYDYCGVLGFSGKTHPERLEVIGNIHGNPELLES